MVYQISVFLENRAGQFAEITGVLAESGIDLRAISIAETADYGILRMIVDNAEKTTALLMQHGYLLSMTPVLVIAVPDQPGGIAPVLATLAEGTSTLKGVLFSDDSRHFLNQKKTCHRAGLFYLNNFRQAAESSSRVLQGSMVQSSAMV